MLRAVLLFVAANAVGEAMRSLLHFPVSGAVLGMVLIFVLFALRSGGIPASVEETAKSMLRLLPLFFVPAGVGVAAHADLIARHWPAVLASMLGSSVIALLITGVTLRLLGYNEAEDKAATPLPERTP